MNTKSYRDSRNKGYPAHVAYAIATREIPTDLDWQGESASTTREGFDIRVRIEPDPDADISYIGEFSDTYQDGAVKNPEYGYTRHVYEWFVPTYTYEERVRDLCALGYSRGVRAELAREQIAKDAQMARTLQSYVIDVIASRNGIELGRDSLGGVDIDEDADARDEFASIIDEHGMVDGAITEARASLRVLCDGK